MFVEQELFQPSDRYKIGPHEFDHQSLVWCATSFCVKAILNPPHSGPVIEMWTDKDLTAEQSNNQQLTERPSSYRQTIVMFNLEILLGEF